MDLWISDLEYRAKEKVQNTAQRKQSNKCIKEKLRQGAQGLKF